MSLRLPRLARTPAPSARVSCLPIRSLPSRATTRLLPSSQRFYSSTPKSIFHPQQLVSSLPLAMYRVPVSKNTARLFSTASKTPESIVSILGMPLEEVQQLDTETITQNWLKALMHGPCISAVIPAKTYETLHLRANRAPMFVFPIPREQGFYSVFFQAKGDKFLFTPLERYQKEGTESLPSLVLNTFHELRQSNGIVLLKGTTEVPTLTTGEAQMLVNIMQIFLLDDAKYSKMEQFNSSPADFNFQEVIEIVERGLQK